MEINGQTGVPFIGTLSDLNKAEWYLYKFLKNLNKKSDYRLYNKNALTLVGSHYLTGSVEGILKNSDLFRDEVITANDFDVIVPLEAKEFLGDLLKSEGIPFRKYGTQFHALVELDGILRQVDFEPKQFDEIGVPSEFAKFSNSWNRQDIHIGLKGAFHKMLLMSITAAWDEEDAFSVAYGIRKRDEEPRVYVTDMEKILYRLFRPTSKADRRLLVSELTHFDGVSWLIKSFIPIDRHQKIYDKFVRKTQERQYDEEQVTKAKNILESYLHLG